MTVRPQSFSYAVKVLDGLKHIDRDRVWAPSVYNAEDDVVVALPSSYYIGTQLGLTSTKGREDIKIPDVDWRLVSDSKYSIHKGRFSFGTSREVKPRPEFHDKHAEDPLEYDARYEKEGHLYARIAIKL